MGTGASMLLFVARRLAGLLRGNGGVPGAPVDRAPGIGDLRERPVLPDPLRHPRIELGIEAGEWTDLGKIESDTSITNSTAHLFLARKLRFGEPEREGTEQIETVKMRFTEALEKIMSGEITHGQTVALVLKANQFLAKENEQ